MSFSTRNLDKVNKEEADKINRWLRQGPKVILQAVVTRTHSTVMQSEDMGGQMMHDSSNAAYNWQISLPGRPSYINYKGRSPVGNEGAQRTISGNSFDIMRVISKRISDDSKKLDRAIWGKVSISKVALINPIYGDYAANANLDEAVMSAYWKPSALIAAQQAFNSWHSSGPKVDWSTQSLPMFGG